MKDIDIVFLDMDHTLIDNDCDVSWKEFLVEIKVAPADERIEAQKHWEAYCAGALDEEAFLAFQLRQFKAHTPEEMRALSRRHLEQRVRPRIYPQAREVIAGVVEETDDQYDVTILISELQRDMELAARNLQFERAAILRDQIKELKDK
ncbi:UvrB/UvrC motif-containing protein, partial [bacterium]|nr:UvrB/UvrC motif-containing protein [bacterium]